LGTIPNKLEKQNASKQTHVEEMWPIAFSKALAIAAFP
jgi:hypothetical protein